MKQTGRRVALDGFGSCLSSFGYLGDLDVYLVKIDRNDVERAMVKAIVGIGSWASHDRRVRHTPVLSVLRENGVDYARGYHLAGPQPFTKYPAPFAASQTQGQA
jgi:EAL domain-containing protein (putative c-di-GMP-specific phosphodiesterase class I)